MTALQQLLAHFQTEYFEPAAAPYLPCLSELDDCIVGHFAGMELHSHFQPLLHSQGLQIQAYEALLRPRLPGQAQFQSPLAAFAQAHNAQQASYLDRLCRVLHALNFERQLPRQHPTQLLFLNVSTQHLQAVSQHYGETFERLLQLCGLRPQQVVLEITESQIDDLTRLQTAVAQWHARGFQIALDDFGCNNSNFDRLWQITPDIVKLDRLLVQQAAHNPRAATILPKLIEMVHDLGASVVCEGVETAIQHQLCQDAGADLVQGYFYARPAAQLLSTTMSMEIADLLEA